MSGLKLILLALVVGALATMSGQSVTPVKVIVPGRARPLSSVMLSVTFGVPSAAVCVTLFIRPLGQ